MEDKSQQEATPVNAGDETKSVKGFAEANRNGDGVVSLGQILNMA